MNKELFLNELQTRIRVLAEAEQQDILDEYAQHIDLKLAKGLSEEAAIADFGSLDELVAEILEAYHVNPTYAAPPAVPGGKVVSVPDPRPALKRGGAATVQFFRRIGGGIAGFFRRCKERMASWIARLRQRPRVERPKKEKKERTAMNIKEPLQSVGRGFRRFFRGLGRLLLALLRLGWNLLLLVVAAPVALAGVLALVCTGTLLVLLTQGYPLAGLTLCCVGGVLCMGSLLVLGVGLRYRRKKPSAPPAALEDWSAPETVQTMELEVPHA